MVKFGAVRCHRSFASIPRPERFLMAFALRPAGSAIWAGAVELIPARCLDFAPRFATERAKAHIEQLSPWHHDFHLHLSSRSEIVR